jgi:predicted SAM-dependent methyltransferase
VVQAITRLQLGTSGLEGLNPDALRTFINSSWLHLGDPRGQAESSERALLRRLRDASGKYGFPYVVKRGLQVLFHSRERAAIMDDGTSDTYKSTNFMSFYYRKGDTLPFDSDSFNFVFSEHFFEHLFLDETLCLMKECYRILRPHGVLRTCVPDADLRTYEAPEPVGFPDRRLPFSDGAKHKTRWSVYSLTEAIRQAGFRPVPLRYCDRKGKYVARSPSDMLTCYAGCLDEEMVLDLSYIMRIDSLIVDGIKCGPDARQ